MELIYTRQRGNQVETAKVNENQAGTRRILEADGFVLQQPEKKGKKTASPKPDKATHPTFLVATEEDEGDSE